METTSIARASLGGGHRLGCGLDQPTFNIRDMAHAGN